VPNDIIDVEKEAKYKIMQYFTLMTSMARPGCRFLFGEKVRIYKQVDKLYAKDNLSQCHTCTSQQPYRNNANLRWHIQ